MEHQLKDLLLHLPGTAVGFIHLIDHHNGFLTHTQSLLQHKTGLRHGPFKGIHQQQDPVGHIQHPFHLASEISMTWCVNDIYLHALVFYRDILCQNGDAPLPLQIVVVHNQLPRLFMLPEDLSHLQQSIYQGCFSMIHMGNDCNISDL